VVAICQQRTKYFNSTGIMNIDITQLMDSMEDLLSGPIKYEKMGHIYSQDSSVRLSWHWCALSLHQLAFFSADNKKQVYTGSVRYMCFEFALNKH
jgi:hypothetical protein